MLGTKYSIHFCSGQSSIRWSCFAEFNNNFRHDGRNGASTAARTQSNLRSPRAYYQSIAVDSAHTVTVSFVA